MKAYTSGFVTCGVAAWALLSVVLASLLMASALVWGLRSRASVGCQAWVDHPDLGEWDEWNRPC